MKTQAPPMAPILRSATQGRILALLFGDPEHERTLTEIAEAVGTSFPTAQREIGRAEAADLVSSRKVGQARLVRANPTARLYESVRDIVVAAFGAPAVLAREISAIDGVAAAAIFGSWAHRYLGEEGPAPNDIDLLVIGDVDRHAVYAAAERAEQDLGLPVQAVFRSTSEWASEDPFLRALRNEPLLVLIVDEDEPTVTDLVDRLETGR